MLDIDDYTFAFIVMVICGFGLLLTWLVDEVDAIRSEGPEVLPPPSALCRKVTGE